MRRFGTEARDLNVDFAALPPYVVTALLYVCGPMKDADAWDLPVGTRTEALFRVACLDGALDIVLRCPQERCGEAVEVEITPAELRAWCAPTECDAASVALSGRELRIRRPTGSDQRAWLEAGWPDARSARRGMLAALVAGPLPGELDAAAMAALEDRLAQIDPLVGFRLTVSCPACGAAASHAVDLEGRALAALRRAQERLLESVARLATRFHWSEREIFALPAWRRERYLSLSDALS